MKETKKHVKKGIWSVLAVASFTPYVWVFPLKNTEQNRSENSKLEQITSIGDNLSDPFQRIFSSSESQGSSNKELNIKEIANYISNHEGKRSKVYCALEPNSINPYKFKQPTVGIGHYLDSGHSKQVFEKTLPEINWEDVRFGRIELTEQQIDRLFQEDLQKHILRAEKLFPNIRSYTLDQQKAILDGIYRGCLSGSPNTRRLIEQGDWERASKEYLNHSEYKNAVRNGRRGVRYRMEKNSNMFLGDNQEREDRHS